MKITLENNAELNIPDNVDAEVLEAFKKIVANYTCDGAKGFLFRPCDMTEEIMEQLVKANK